MTIQTLFRKVGNVDFEVSENFQQPNKNGNPGAIIRRGVVTPSN